ncbi:glutaredoxin family protein [Aerococcaceae bacterium zg-ZJ1578]|uniref:glutaredoxin family protein n=1 Tax=Aerococcaceae bacterium zg-252 TaxID=2796928 RepID=UPI001A2FE162|nr:glutaredoxin family protein [Aerococcaceae bacterium zg-1578]MBR7928397.1 glutaredoxin family protein [Aerococcaceae bacterium zg-ZUI334]
MAKKKEIIGIVEEAVMTETAVEQAVVKPKVKKHAVTVYGKPGCTQCEYTKKYLTDMGTPFNYVDVTIDTEAFEEVKAYGYLGFPVVAINSLDDSWGGFRPDKLEELRGVK